MKKKLTNHAKQRIRERCGVNISSISNRKLQDVFKNQRLFPARKLTISRSIYYGKINGEGIKIIVNKNGVIVTVLPLKHDYETKVFFVGDYSIKLFPDCFIETGNPVLMTEYRKLNEQTGKYEDTPKRKKNNFFNIFNDAWHSYLYDKFLKENTYGKEDKTKIKNRYEGNREEHICN